MRLEIDEIYSKGCTVGRVTRLTGSTNYRYLPQVMLVLRPGIGYIGTQNLRDPVGILGFMSLLKRTGRKT